MSERVRERELARERQRERETDRQRETDRDRETDRERETETERDRQTADRQKKTKRAKQDDDKGSPSSAWRSSGDALGREPVGRRFASEPCTLLSLGSCSQLSFDSFLFPPLL